MRDVPLAAVLAAVAERFGLAQSRVRLGARDIEREARRVYCYLARGLTQADAAQIGELVVEDAGEVEAMIGDVASRLTVGREFAELVVAVELEIRALVELSKTHGLALPTTAAPEVTALRLVKSPREAGMVSIGDLAALGASFLARKRVPPKPVASAFIRAAEAFDAARNDALTFRFTSLERGALEQRERALQALLSHLGVERVEAQEENESEGRRARAAESRGSGGVHPPDRREQPDDRPV